MGRNSGWICPTGHRAAPLVAHVGLCLDSMFRLHTDGVQSISYAMLQGFS